MDQEDRRGEAPRRGRPASGADAAILAAALGLIEQDGLARLTTRAVARRAGVSEASVFYHFGDKVGLLQAVLLAGLAPLSALGNGPLAVEDRPLEQSLVEVARAFESFFDAALPICEAAQSDASLRDQFAARLIERDLGPHRGVEMFAALLDDLGRNGRAAPASDTQATAILLIGACFLRAWVRHLSPDELLGRLPAVESIGAALASLLAPKKGARAS